MTPTSCPTTSPKAAPCSAAVRRVLVIGTSIDYIATISHRFPGRALFVTDPQERARGAEPSPAPQDELLVDMAAPGQVMEQLLRHCSRYNMQPGGVACFDDESMHLAALLAQELGLPYLAPEAVLRCRCKLRSKQLWLAAGLDCPAAVQIDSPADAAAFWRQQGRIMLKPLTGSGSELLFDCSTGAACLAAGETMKQGLTGMLNERMYAPYTVDGCYRDPRTSFIAEPFRQGEEYSCDLLVTGSRLGVIRVTHKHLLPGGPSGTIMAYQLCTGLPVDRQYVLQTLRTAVQSLGIEQGLCMIDFLLDHGRIVLLELAPRPGGDCLPPLLLTACGLDSFDNALSVAEGRRLKLPQPGQCRPLVGLRLFAPLPGGIITCLDTTSIAADPRVIKVQLSKIPGHPVTHPPADYFSRILGHALFEPYREADAGQECRELLGLLKVQYQEDETA